VSSLRHWLGGPCSPETEQFPSVRPTSNVVRLRATVRIPTFRASYVVRVLAIRPREFVEQAYVPGDAYEQTVFRRSRVVVALRGARLSGAAAELPAGLAPVFVSRVTVRGLRRRCQHLNSLVEHLPFRARTNEAKLGWLERLGIRVMERHHI
jgi:hypothetical protein